MDAHMPEPEAQEWVIVNMDSRQRTDLQSLQAFLSHNIFRDPLIINDTKKKLMRPFLRRPSFLCPAGRPPAETPETRQQHLSFGSLPPELIKTVFDEIDDLCDAVHLALVNSMFLEIALQRIYELATSLYAPWIGQRLICVGSATRIDDLPSETSSYANQWLSEVKDLRRGRDETEDQAEPPRDMKLFKLMTELDFTSTNDILALQAQLWSMLSLAPQLVSVDDRLTADHFIETIAPYYGPPSGEWVLCNLSKREYIRERAARDDSGELIRWDLGRVLLPRICWSSVSTIGIAGNGSFPPRRGPWAGDRFEITTIERLQEPNDWKDISEEVVPEFITFWHKQAAAGLA